MLSSDDRDPTTEHAPNLAPNEDVIERTASGEAPLWLWTQTCPDEDCPCRMALIVAATTREQLVAHADVVRRAWEESEDAATFNSTVPADIIAFEIEIDSGEVSMPLADEIEISSAVARVAERMDGELLDRLASQWHLGKDFGDAANQPVQPSEIRDFRPGQLLAWDEVYSGARMDFYAHEGSTFEFIDTYCVRPKCECNEVHIQSYQLPSLDWESDGLADDTDDDSLHADEADDDTDDDGSHADDHTFVGTVAVKLEDPVQIAYHASQDQGGVLERLFALYQRRYPNWVARLVERADKMASFGEKLNAYLDQKQRKPWVGSSRKRKAKRH